MQDLAQLMCDPMVEYVKGLRDDMNNGISVRLLAMVKEMERVIRDGRLELEEARNKVRVAEERKFEALSRLTESEERVKKMKEYLRSLAEPNTRGSMQRPVAHKVIFFEPLLELSLLRSYIWCCIESQVVLVT